MGDVEVISDFFVKGIKENKTDKYVAMFLIPGNGSIIGLGGTEYIDLINAEKFGQIFERVREKLGNPDFKFDTIIMISNLMGNAEFMHTVKDYADYYIGSEANEYHSTFNLYEYFQEAGKGYDSINAGNALISSYKSKADEYNLPLDLNMIDLSKIDLLSNALDNMSKVMLENYNKSTTDAKKTINNFFLSAYDAINYNNGQVDIYTLLDRIGHTTDYYTDDYTASKNEIQAAIKEAVVNKVSTGIYQYGQGISTNAFPGVYLDTYNYNLGNISFAPEYLSFIKKISQEIMKDKNSAVPEITASYNNGLEYIVKTPVAISSAQVDIDSFEEQMPENNRVGTLANVVIPEQEYDETAGLFTYKFNFGDPAKSFMFTLNGNPVRVQSISGYKANDNISYYKTLDTYCSLNNENIESNLIIKYDKSTANTEIVQMNVYNILYNNIYLTKCDKFIIAPYSGPVEYAGTTENTPGEDEYIPDYEIPIDKTAEAGRVEAYVVEYNVYEVEPQYRLSFTTVDTLGYDEPTTSTWQTLSEIQGAVSQQ